MLLASAGRAADKPVMTWLLQDLPPVSMPVEGRPTVGVTDVLLHLIAQRWPEADHRYQVTNIARAQGQLAQGEQACINGLVITPERERIALLTPSNLVLPLQLITRQDMLKRLPRNEAGEVLPATLLERPGLRGVLVRQRSYTPLLDALLQGGTARPGAIDYAVTADNAGNLFKMVAMGRADYTLDYDFALAYQQQRDPRFFKDKHLVSVPIAGLQPFVSGIACPRTPWGREVMLRIDAIVASLASHPDYVNAADRWLSPETRKRYKAARAEFFRKRAARSDPAKFDLGAPTPP